MASYSDIFNLNFKVLKYLGFLNIESKSVLKTRLYFLYQWLSLIILTLFNLLAFTDLYLIRHDFEKFAFNLCVAAACLMGLIKTFIALGKLPEINRLHNNLKRDLTEEKNEECKKFLSKAAWEMNFLNKFYYSATVFLMAIWVLTPLLDYKSGERKLPFRQWFPFDVDSSPNYELVYVYQVISCVYISSNIISSDLATYGFLIRISAEYDVLKVNLKKLNGVYENKGEERLKDVETWKIIKDCVVHHQEMILRTRQFEEIYNKIIAVQFMAASIVLAVIGVNVTVVSTEFSSKFMTQIVYLSNCMINLFFFSLYGTRVQYKSYEIAEAASNTPWYLIKSRFRGSLSFIIAKAQQPPIITGGKIFIVNFNAYLKLLRTAYNMLALLHQMASKNKN